MHENAHIYQHTLCSHSHSGLATCKPLLIMVYTLCMTGKVKGGWRPAVIFDHSLFRMMVSFYEPRTTSNEPRLFWSMRHDFANCDRRPATCEPQSTNMLNYNNNNSHKALCEGPLVLYNVVVKILKLSIRYILLSTEEVLL